MTDNIPTTKTTDNFLSSNIKDLSPESKESLLKMALESKIKLDEKIVLDELKNKEADIDFNRHIQALQSLEDRRIKGIDHVRTEINTASGHMKLDSKSSKCYVATATYQNAYHPNVVILRDYRDRFLTKTIKGRVFIKFYYATGRYLAFFPEHCKFIRVISKKALDSIVGKIIRKHYLSVK